MLRIVSSVIAVAISCVSAAEQAAARCPPEGFDTVKHFDLDSFVSKRWYAQQQMEVFYLPTSKNRCVYAEYAKKRSILGYDLTVRNHAEDIEAPHRDSDVNICAKVVDAQRGQLKVAPCFLPSAFAGAYWILDYNEVEGYALISGGAPKNSAAGGCRTGTGVNGSGLWIFTRQQQRDQELVDKVRGIAAQKGLDVSVLNDVDQTCNDGRLSEQTDVQV